MRFYYYNYMGDEGFFSEDNIVKAIYTAWNIEADLCLVMDKTVRRVKDVNMYSDKNVKLIFSPQESNEFNSELLEEFGYRMEDGEKYREIINIKTGKIIRYDWAEVKQLV